MGRAIQLRQFQALLLSRTSDPPYFLLLVGLFISLTSGLVFVVMLLPIA